MMRWTRLFLVGSLLLVCSTLLADADVAAAAPEKFAADEAACRACLKKSLSFMRSISTSGGYCGIYSLDLKKRYGEATYQPVKPGCIWIQPPGTPSMGKLFLRAFKATADPWYLEGAVSVGKALTHTQSRRGGWIYVVKVTPDESRRPGRATFDDNTSQEAISFLMALDGAVDHDWLDKAVSKALRFLAESQYPAGGWPQSWPGARGYHAHYTFNDNAINDCIRVAWEAYDRYKKDAYKAIALKAGDFIRRAQLPQGGWAQQYDMDLKPAWARSFEPPGLCSLVTARNMDILMGLARRTGDPRFAAPLKKAVVFLNGVKLPSGQWARLYEQDTLRPIYGDRDGKVHYDLNEISEERRRGYSWQSTYGIPGTIARVKVQLAGGDPFPPGAPPKPAQLLPRVKQILAACDARGRFVRDNMISTGDAVRNGNVLAGFLESVGSLK